jgi:hypothetical protein
MKRLPLGLFILFLTLSCSNSKKTSCREYGLVPKENIQVLLDSFISENKRENYIYELYIDKVDPNNYNMILYAGEKSLTKAENEYYCQKAAMYTVTQGVRIYIYSGIERYFTSSCVIDTLPLQNGIEDDRVLWAIRDSLGVLSSYEIDVGYPFIPLPIKNESDDFAPPIVSSE